MKLGPRGEALIKSYEELRLEAYMPTPKDRPTIGWGHTRGVKMGMTCTMGQAQKWFEEDVASAVTAVESLSIRMTESMADALISLVFNVGPGALSGPAIGVNLRTATTHESYYAAWAGVALWRKQAGKSLLGLARRRAREMVLFLEDGMPN